MHKLSELEVRHLRTLIEIRDRETESREMYKRAVEDYALELSDAGASLRAIEAGIGIAHETVKGWVDNARRRRDR